jgi:hypothetical protein
VCAAGRLRVNREGHTVHVTCWSTDYPFKYHNEKSFTYIIESFKGHRAFMLSEHAVFQFHSSPTSKIFRSTSGGRIDKPYERLKLLDEEGLGDSVSVIHTPVQVIQFENYSPIRPPRLYGMHLDHSISSIDEADDEGFEYGEPAPRLDLRQTTFRPGKNNFVIDRDGFLIVGISGHQILSGGQAVAAAGHIHFDSRGSVVKLETNFSGHYRPPLSADYLRYVYQVIAKHPLILLDDNCQFRGRWFDEESMNSKPLEFHQEDLESDDPRLDQWIEGSF